MSHFTTYQIAVKAKELGYNEEDYGMYNKEEFVMNLDGTTLSNSDIEELYNSGTVISAPLWQQVIPFLHKKLNEKLKNGDISSTIRMYSDNSGEVEVLTSKSEGLKDKELFEFYSLEDLCNKLIKEVEKETNE